MPRHVGDIAALWVLQVCKNLARPGFEPSTYRVTDKPPSHYTSLIQWLKLDTEALYSFACTTINNAHTLCEKLKILRRRGSNRRPGALRTHLPTSTTV